MHPDVEEGLQKLFGFSSGQLTGKDYYYAFATPPDRIIPPTLRASGT
jgi:hypothetical protein